jgi:hypothetical protein
MFPALRALVTGSLLTLIVSCATGPAIRVDSDPVANFSAYRSFGFLDPLSTDRQGYSTLLSARLRDATRRELEARGYVFDQAKPDLLINFNVNVVQRTEVRSSPSFGAAYGYYGYRYGLYGAWPGYPYDVYTTNYRQGTLVIDAVDAERDALVWQGVAEGRVKKEHLENPAPAIDAAVSQILAQFPGRLAPAAAADGQR